MIAALDANGGVIGYFLERQVGSDPAAALHVIQQDYQLTDAVDTVEIDEDFHALAMHGQKSGQLAYVSGDVAQLRPLMTPQVDAGSIAANTGQTHSAVGLPEGAVIRVNGQDAGVVEGGAFQLIADTPGQYIVTIEQWPYMPFSYVVRAD